MDLRRLLNKSYTAFFGGFGKWLPIQRLAIPAILAGKNVVICSSTASGKTEAVAAPVAELLLRYLGKGLRVIYLVPTRALANDLLLRLHGPLEELGIRTVLRHGDRPVLPSGGVDWMITTPESLDSMVCRKPELFDEISTVILDEVHFLDNTYRGDQLRVLLERVRHRIRPRALSVHLLSATIARPENLASRYVSSFEVVEVPGARQVSLEVVRDLHSAWRAIKSRRWRKVLCFCNSRETAEVVAGTLGQIATLSVLTHHGSLSRAEREEAEEIMRQSPAAICVSTSTLEVGVDIGDIDAVMLPEIPWSVSAFAQRVGRANRREPVINALVVAEDAATERVVEAMIGHLAEGRIEETPYTPDWSVVIQQIMSVLFQYPEGVQRDYIEGIVTCLAEADVVGQILSHLRENGWVDSWRDRIVATTRLMDLGQRGKIHSNIPDEGAFKVVDCTTSREVGTIAGVFDDVFVLSRRVWKVVSVSDRTVTVAPFRAEASPAVFRPRKRVGAFHYLLPPSLKRPA